MQIRLREEQGRERNVAWRDRTPNEAIAILESALGTAAVVDEEAQMETQALSCIAYARTPARHVADEDGAANISSLDEVNEISRRAKPVAGE